MEKNNKSSEEFFVRLTTGGRVNAIENWLNEHAQGDWTIKVDGLSEDLMKRTTSSSSNAKKTGTDSAPIIVYLNPGVACASLRPVNE